MRTGHFLNRLCVFLVLCLEFASGALLAQEATFPVAWGCGGNLKNDTVGFNFKPVDLDHDGRADFRFVRMSASAVHPTLPITDPLYCYFSDSTQAYFAEEHVQMYLGPIPSGCAMSLPAAVLAPGTIIPAKPAASNAWQWANPYGVPSLQGIGFGRTIRSQVFTDPHIPRGGWEPGYLHATRAPILTNALFGFRLPSADGWHSGWMRLGWFLDYRPPETAENVRMVEYAVNPIPDSEIVAGVHVGPPLQIATSTTNGTTIRISWPTTATNVILESKSDLRDTKWETVQGVTNNEVTIKPTNASSFYQLKGQ
jgi:hypothetical protein